MRLKVHVIIIMRFGENNVLCPKYIFTYEFGWGVLGGNVHIHRTLFVYYSKKRKEYRSMTYTKIKFYMILISSFFPRMNNKKFRKTGPQGPHEVSIVVLIDFIAIVLPPGIF